MSNPRNLAIHEHQLIGDIIADSFSDDPVNSWVFDSVLGMQHFYPKAAKKLYLAKGYGRVMEDNSGGSLWLPPKIKKHIPAINSLDIAASMVRHGGLKSIIRGIKVDEALKKAKPKQPHYYLFAIGARTGMQGKGIGGKLMKKGLTEVDCNNMPTYLESSKEENVPFYQRFGFEVIKKLVPATNCPPLWLMWREARK